LPKVVLLNAQVIWDVTQCHAMSSFWCSLGS